MKVKNVVKVMNFHSLLRVDKARKEAEKYFLVERQLRNMINSIANNRNLSIDINLLRVNPTKPVLNIYVGSDLGFCGSYNSVMTNDFKNDDNYKILIGKKINKKSVNVLLSLTKEEYWDDTHKVSDIIEEGILKRQFSEINVIYNQYLNISHIELTKKKIYPFDFNDSDEELSYTEDYVSEADLEELLQEMISTYVDYELQIVIKNAFASENVLRQSSTSESLKKIDELETEKEMEERKEASIISSNKNVERYIKHKASNKVVDNG